MANHLVELKVQDIIHETEDTRSIIFEVPEDQKELFKYKSGQYLTLSIPFDGKEERRAYSISSAPHEPILKVSVKRVPKGSVSTYLCDELKTGHKLKVLPPEGNFTYNFNPAKKRVHFFFAAGSGITPIISLIKNGLENEPLSQFCLLDGNRQEDQIIFQQEIAELKSKYANQFVVQHTLSGLKKGGFMNKLFGRKTEASPNGYWAGRIDADKVREFVESNKIVNVEPSYFICGPGDMIKLVEDTLKSMEVEHKYIHVEYFFNEGDAPKVDNFDGHVKLTALLDGSEYTTEIKKGQTILDALIDIGADPPYSCTSGVCSTCMAKLHTGKVEMETCLALDEEEVADGYILTCQSHPKTDTVKVEYE